MQNVTPLRESVTPSVTAQKVTADALEPERYEVVTYFCVPVVVKGTYFAETAEKAAAMAIEATRLNVHPVKIAWDLRSGVFVRSVTGDAGKVTVPAAAPSTARRYEPRAVPSTARGFSLGRCNPRNRVSAPKLVALDCLRAAVYPDPGDP